MEILEDNRLFKVIGLIKQLELKLNCSADDFINYFHNNVGTGQNFIGLQRPKKEFQGSIGRRAFKISRSMTLLDSNLSTAYGTFDENNNKIKVNVWTYLPIGTFLIYATIVLTINIFTVFVILSVDKVQENIWPFILGLSVFWIWSTLFPYFSFKNGVKKLTYDIERELYSWTVKQTHANTGFV